MEEDIKKLVCYNYWYDRFRHIGSVGDNEFFISLLNPNETIDKQKFYVCECFAHYEEDLIEWVEQNIDWKSRWQEDVADWYTEASYSDWLDDQNWYDNIDWNEPWDYNSDDWVYDWFDKNWQASMYEREQIEEINYKEFDSYDKLIDYLKEQLWEDFISELSEDSEEAELISNFNLVFKWGYEYCYWN